MSANEAAAGLGAGLSAAPTRFPRGPRLILKVGLEGDIYVNYRRVDLSAMLEAVRQTKQRGGCVVYYRESPTGEGSDRAMDVFKQVMELKPIIQLGNDVPSEWGQLDWAELEEAPDVSRFFLARGQEFLMSAPGMDAVYLTRHVDPRLADRLLNNVDFLVRADRMLETPMHEPELCFQPGAQSKGSLHIRLRYGDKGWVSHYAAGAAPGNVLSFQHDVLALARQTAEVIRKHQTRSS